MKITIITIDNIPIAEVISENMIISETQDVLDIMAEAQYLGSSRIILNEEQLTPKFFDLKTGIAGEILQKFSTYDCKLAIIGNFEKYQSKSLRDFIFESNKYGRVNFVNNLDEAKEKLRKI